MAGDDPAALGAGRLRGEDVFLLAQGQDLAADESCHRDPVEDGEDDEEADDVAADLGQRRAVELVADRDLQDRGEQDDHQRIGQGVDDIDDAHDDEVDLAAAVACDGADRHADDQHDEAREEADGEGNARAVDDTDEVVAPGGVGAEDMREDLFTLFDALELGLAVLEGSEVIERGVDGLAGTHAQLLVVGVRPEGGDEDGRKRDDGHDDQAYERDLVPAQAHLKAPPFSR